MPITYVLIGLFWAALCLGIGAFIRLRNNSYVSQFKIGFLAIFISYSMGLALLAAAIVFGS